MDAKAMPTASVFSSNSRMCDLKDAAGVKLVKRHHVYAEMDRDMIRWLQQQRMFFVATAPASG
jgi:hypothetical protein